jgi:hypothetical protein
MMKKAHQQKHHHHRWESSKEDLSSPWTENFQRNFPFSRRKGFVVDGEKEEGK